MLYHLPKNKWPKYLLEYPSIKNIWVGGCWFGHSNKAGKYTELAHSHWALGMICVFDERYLACKNLMLHEVAHLLTKSTHTDKWRRCLLSIGGTLDKCRVIEGKMMADYHKGNVPRCRSIQLLLGS